MRRWSCFYACVVFLVLGCGGNVEDDPSPHEVVASLPRVADFPDTLQYRGRALYLVHEGVPGESITYRWASGESTTAKVDSDGLVTVALPSDGLPDRQELSISEEGGETRRVTTVRTHPTSPSNSVPTLRSGAVEPGRFPTTESLRSWDDFAGGAEPRDGPVLLADLSLEVVAQLEGIAWDIVGPSFSFGLWHQSRFSYDGPTGVGTSYSSNLFVTRTDGAHAFLVTPNLGRIGLHRTLTDLWEVDGDYPFRVRRIDDERRWEVTTFDGQQYELIDTGVAGLPGHLVSVRDIRHDLLTLVPLDFSGFQTGFRSLHGPDVTYKTGSNGRITEVSDATGRTWALGYAGDRLDTVQHPGALHTVPTLGVAPADAALSLATTRPTDQFAYDPDCGWLTSWSRGNTTYVDVSYDSECTIESAAQRGRRAEYRPGPSSEPSPLALLDPGNRIVRVEVDDSDELLDFELHGPDGNAAGNGAFGLRREVVWTRSARAMSALRSDEPQYFERRFGHIFSGLVPEWETAQFSDSDLPSLTVRGDGLPTNWPHYRRSFNDRWQVRELVRSDGLEDITTSYAITGFDDFSVVETATTMSSEGSAFLGDQRSVTTFGYNDAADLETMMMKVSRGRSDTVDVVERWSYDDLGRVSTHTSPAGNIVRFEYNNGPVTGVFGSSSEQGYCIKSTTSGATGSLDPAVEIVNAYLVNPHCQITEFTDGNDNTYLYTYDALGRHRSTQFPPVTLLSGEARTYSIEYVLDASGTRVAERSTNEDYDGTPSANATIDTTYGHDRWGRVTQVRREVDDDASHDRIETYAFRGEHLAAYARPNGTRTFEITDERGLLHRRFFNVPPSGTGDILDDYPTDPSSSPSGTDIIANAFLYNSAGILSSIARADGGTRVLLSDSFGRSTGTSDEDGGTRALLDRSGNALTEERFDGDGTTYARLYYRYDELGRRYLAVEDRHLATDESDLADPLVPPNVGATIVNDASSRITRVEDTAGDIWSFSYNSVDRIESISQPSGDIAVYDYGGNLNVLSLSLEGDDQTDVSFYEYDALNRLVRARQDGTGPEGSGPEVLYGYDAGGNLQVIQSFDVAEFRRAFNDQGQLIADRRYDGASLLSSRTLTYDDNGQPTSE